MAGITRSGVSSDQATTEDRRRRRRTTKANEPNPRNAADAGSGTALGALIVKSKLSKAESAVALKTKLVKLENVAPNEVGARVPIGPKTLPPIVKVVGVGTKPPRGAKSKLFKVNVPSPV